MRIIAIIATYNEELFIGRCLEHLFAHGVDVYLIDNCSQDETLNIAESYAGRGLIGIETYPRDDNTYRWERILRRKEELADSLDADWFIHADPDEFRLPPRSDRTLATAIHEVDAEGYNAVNFFEFSFIPTIESPSHEHVDFVSTMLRYYPFEPRSMNQIKAWKRQPSSVGLAWSAGHRVRFPKLKVYPVNFPMRHYLFLSLPHLIRKYTARKYDPAEVKHGWHGWRNRLNPELVRLPSDKELRYYVGDDLLDPKRPRLTHLVEEQINGSPDTLRARLAGLWRRRAFK
jgi:glycosyltransferase involved in cell wall biosynthesis